MDLNEFAWISLLKIQNVQIGGKTSRFVNTNPREFENLYILLGFINTVWISKSIKIYKRTIVNNLYYY